jgi:hypothetical protein
VPYAIGLSGGLASAALLACTASCRPALALTIDGGGGAGDHARRQAEGAGVPWAAVKLDADAIGALLSDGDDDWPVLSAEGLVLRALAAADHRKFVVAGVALALESQLIGNSESFEPRRHSLDQPLPPALLSFPLTLA